MIPLSLYSLGYLRASSVDQAGLELEVCLPLVLGSKVWATTAGPPPLGCLLFLSMVPVLPLNSGAPYTEPLVGCVVCRHLLPTGTHLFILLEVSTTGSFLSMKSDLSTLSLKLGFLAPSISLGFPGLAEPCPLCFFLLRRSFPDLPKQCGQFFY